MLERIEAKKKKGGVSTAVVKRVITQKGKDYS